MRLALAQMNTVVGDLDGNRERIVTRLEEAREAGADLVLFPELATTGYPPEDLLLRPGFLRAAARTLDAVAMGDLVSVYLAILYQTDPTPVTLLAMLKERLARSTD